MNGRTPNRLGWNLLCGAVLGLASCQSGGYQGDDTVARMPVEVPTPDGASFDYLLYDNDFNAVPMDADPERYVASVLDSPAVGLVYHLTREREFSPGLHVRLNETPNPGWYRISLQVLQQAEDVRPALQRGFVVVSIERGDSTLVYEPYAIDEWLQQHHRQVVDKWERLTFWHPVEQAQAGDVLKVYVWNPEGGDLHVDDLRVERWRVAPNPEATHQQARVLLEQSYEGAVGAEQNTEQAYRGIHSALLTHQGVPYGAGYNGTLAEAGLRAGDGLQIHLMALKQHGVRQADRGARMVVSLERNGRQVYWKGWAIDPRIWKDGQQTLNEWTPLTWWTTLPADARPTDLLRVYPWNGTEQRLFIDDLVVEAWTAKAN